jgi:hypothetical protein
VNSKCGFVDCAISFDYLAVFIYQNQVRNPNLRKVHPERIHPKVIFQLWIARRNVSSYALAEPEFAKNPEGGGVVFDANAVPQWS